MVSDVSSSDASDALAKNRVKVSWLVFVIALTGLLINFIYFGIELLSSESLLDDFRNNFYEHIFILSLIIQFPLVVYLTDRVMVGFRMSERSRALELEVAARTREVEDLKSFSENIMASVNDVIFVIASNGRFQFVSGDSEAVLGFEPEALLGRQFIDIVASGSIATAVNSFEKVMWGQEVLPYEIEVVDGRGDTRMIEVSGTAYREDGQVVAQVGVARDVTERKKLEQHVF